MASIRPAAVAGQFYPGDPRQLLATVERLLREGGAGDGPAPKAIIAPHAGYVYSGAVAARAYARLRPARAAITRVVLLGPCHRVGIEGLALSGAEAFATPLGNVAVDRGAAAGIVTLPQVKVHDATHRMEHSLEVHLPFLQVALDDFKVVPLVVGVATPEEVAAVLEALWGGPETLIVVSTDLSHYLDYDSARRMDAATCRAIEALDLSAVGRHQACGRFPMNGLLALARKRGLRVETVDLRNSGDTAGPRDRVVGYGSWLFFESPAPTAKAAGEGDFAAATRTLLKMHGAALLNLAAASIECGMMKGHPLPVDLDTQPDALRAAGACFVTLKRQGRLRGCIGSPTAHRPLAIDAADNAFRSAFRDPRFPKLTAPEVDGLELSISVLSAPSPIVFAGEAELVRQLRPGIDGLVIEDARRRALFLPSVWEQIPDKARFLVHLKVKAGLKSDHWSPAFRAWRFVAEEVKAADLDDPAAIWSGGRLV